MEQWSIFFRNRSFNLSQRKSHWVPVCGVWFKYFDNIITHVEGDMISNNSQADVSELLENTEETYIVSNTSIDKNYYIICSQNTTMIAHFYLKSVSSSEILDMLIKWCIVWHRIPCKSSWNYFHNLGDLLYKP